MLVGLVGLGLTLDLPKTTLHTPPKNSRTTNDRNLATKSASPWSVRLTHCGLTDTPLDSDSIRCVYRKIRRSLNAKSTKTAYVSLRSSTPQNGPWISLGMALVRSPPTCVLYQRWY